MTYLSLTEYLDIFGREEAIALTDRAGTGNPGEAVIEAAIAGAASLADSYLGTTARHIQALPETPPALRRALADMVRCSLYDAGAPEEVTRRQQAATAWLRDLAAGRAQLTGVDAAPSAVAPVSTQPPRHFGSNQTRGF